MNWFIGLRRILVLLSILYWVCAVRIAIVQSAAWGFAADPWAILGSAAWIYLVCFGFFWAVLGFFIWPGRRY
jgi:hypothetical protein